MTGSDIKYFKTHFEKLPFTAFSRTKIISEQYSFKIFKIASVICEICLKLLGRVQKQRFEKNGFKVSLRSRSSSSPNDYRSIDQPCCLSPKRSYYLKYDFKKQFKTLT